MGKAQTSFCIMDANFSMGLHSAQFMLMEIKP